MILFISGGARSGKSSYAEKKASSLRTKGGRLFYIATAKRSDDEMEKRIDIHRQERGKEWHVFEEPFDISYIFEGASKGDVILLDCLTIWLSNRMFDMHSSFDQTSASVKNWIKLAKEKGVALILVSNDLNEGVPSGSELVNRYIYNLELLHQSIVNEADAAVQVVAGIPIYWKGEET